VDVAILFCGRKYFWFLLVPSLMGSALILAAYPPARSFSLSSMGFALAFPILSHSAQFTQTLFIILILALQTALVLPFLAAIELRLHFDIRAHAYEPFDLETLRQENARRSAYGCCASRKLRPKGSNPD
jgi:hypothetical protein